MDFNKMFKDLKRHDPSLAGAAVGTVAGFAVFAVVFNIALAIRSDAKLRTLFLVVFIPISVVTWLFYPTLAALWTLLTIPILCGFLPIVGLSSLVALPLLLWFDHLSLYPYLAIPLGAIEILVSSEGVGAMVGNVAVIAAAFLPITLNWALGNSRFEAARYICLNGSKSQCEAATDDLTSEQIESIDLEQKERTAVAALQIPPGCAIGQAKQPAGTVDLLSYIRAESGNQFVDEDGHVATLTITEKPSSIVPGAIELNYGGPNLGMESSHIDYDGCRIFGVVKQGKFGFGAESTAPRFINPNSKIMALLDNVYEFPIFTGKISFQKTFKSRIGNLSDCIRLQSDKRIEVFCKNMGLVESMDRNYSRGFTMVSSRVGKTDNLAAYVNPVRSPASEDE